MLYRIDLFTKTQNKQVFINFIHSYNYLSKANLILCFHLNDFNYWLVCCEHHKTFLSIFNTNILRKRNCSTPIELYILKMHHCLQKFDCTNIYLDYKLLCDFVQWKLKSVFSQKFWKNCDFSFPKQVIHAKICF